jgi:hypothetical protein
MPQKTFPFNLNFPDEVTEEKGFYGRHGEREQIERTLTSGTGRPVIIEGERRIGKTSLQRVTAKVIADKTGGHYVPLFLPPYRAMQSLEDFAKEILQALCSLVGRNLQETGLTDSLGRFQFSSYGEFADVVGRLVAGAPDRVFVLCVDEFDSIMMNCSDAAEARKILGLTDHLTGLAHRLPLVVYLTVTRLLPEMRDSYGSPGISKSEFVKLGPLASDEAREMSVGLLENQVKFAVEVYQALYRLSGGHPYFVKLLLDRLLIRYWSGRAPLLVTQDMVGEIEQDAVHDRRAEQALENIFKVHFSDDEKALTLLLAHRQAPIGPDGLRVLGPEFESTAKVLVNRDYLIRDEQEHCDFRIGLLGRWLREWEQYETECERLKINKLERRLDRLADPWAHVTRIAITEDDLRGSGS